MPPHVRLQVARLGIHLPAAGIQTRENLVVVFDVRFGRRVLPEKVKSMFKCLFAIFIAHRIVRFYLGIPVPCAR